MYGKVKKTRSLAISYHYPRLPTSDVPPSLLSNPNFVPNKEKKANGHSQKRYGRFTKQSRSGTQDGHTGITPESKRTNPEHKKEQKRKRNPSLPRTITRRKESSSISVFECLSSRACSPKHTGICIRISSRSARQRNHPRH